jgi:hypothetical protein
MRSPFSIQSITVELLTKDLQNSLQLATLPVAIAPSPAGSHGSSSSFSPSVASAPSDACHGSISIAITGGGCMQAYDALREGLKDTIDYIIIASII